MAEFFIRISSAVLGFFASLAIIALVGAYLVYAK